MKKALIIIAAALFVAAMVLPAMAVDISIGGFYRVRGIYQSNAQTFFSEEGDEVVSDVEDLIEDITGEDITIGRHAITPFNDYGSPDAWWDHHLQLNPVFKVADNLKLVTRVSLFNNQMWGSGNTSGSIATTGALSATNFNEEADNIVWNRAYIDWATPKGTLKVGRMAGNFSFFLPWGNTELDADRIMYYSPAWNGFSFYAFHEKRNEQSVTSGKNIADEDENRYAILFSYAQPCCYLGYALDYYRDRTVSQSVTSGWKADYYKHVFCLKANDPTNTYFFEGELQIQDGDYQNYYSATQDVDRKGWGYYANLGMKKDPLTVGVATSFVSGDNNPDDADYDAGPATGLDFQPLYILYGPYSNVLTGYDGGFGMYTALPGLYYGGSQAYWLYGDYQCNPQLTLHGALGVANVDKQIPAINQDDELGKELNLGLKYQIMSNLAYELHMGYLWTGDYFKFGTLNVDRDDVYQIDHSLTLSF